MESNKLDGCIYRFNYCTTLTCKANIYATTYSIPLQLCDNYVFCRNLDKINTSKCVWL